MNKLVTLFDLNPKDIKTAEALVTQRLRELGLLYQHWLYPIVMGLPNDRDLVIVETGVYSGISTYFILKALEDREAAGLTGGVLYSCDPRFKSQADAENKLSTNRDGWPHFFGDNARLFKRWKLFPCKSRDAFPEMPESWDMFVHDSDHSAENMTMELDEMLMRAEPGAPVIIDDHAGDIDFSGIHNAFEKWLKKQPVAGSVEFTEVEKAAFFRVPVGAGASIVAPEAIGTSPSVVATSIPAETVVAAPALGRAPSEPPTVAEQVAVAAALGDAAQVGGDAAKVGDDAAQDAADEDEDDLDEEFDDSDDDVFNDDELDELEENDKEE